MSNSKRPKIMKTSKFDDFQSPEEAVNCLLPYIPNCWSIWEPACGKGNLVRALVGNGYNVHATDKKMGRDFLVDALKPEFYQAIITNPPFSIKDEFLARCYDLGKPFALLLPTSIFDSIERRRLMDQYGVQLIIPNKRFNFETPNHEENKKEGKKVGGSWFFTFWVTCGLNLPKQINFQKHVDKVQK